MEKQQDLIEIFFGLYGDGKEVGKEGKDGSKDASTDTCGVCIGKAGEAQDVDYQF